MTLSELQAVIGTWPSVTRKAMINAAAQIAHDAVTHAKSKIGGDSPQPETGLTPGWAPLAQETILRKAMEGYPIPAYLKREGELRDSIGATIEDKRDGFVVNLLSDSEVAYYQEVGTLTIPPRSFLLATVAERVEYYAKLTGLQIELAMCPPGATVELDLYLTKVFREAS